MSLRFRRSIKLAPGIRINFSGSGLSMTMGPRGASVSVGRRGTYLNTGIPGTGLYSRTKLSGTGTSDRPSSSPPTNIESLHPIVQKAVTIAVEDDGTIKYKDEAGQPVNDYVANELKKQKGPELHAILQNYAKTFGEQIRALVEVHWTTPDPTIKPSFEIVAFNEPEPQLPNQPALRLLDRLLPWRRSAIEASYSAALASSLSDQDDWQRRKAYHSAQQVRRKIFLEGDIYRNVHSMESFLGEHLQAVHWPRETHVTFEIQDNGAKVLLDVDLPEIEQMPTKTATASGRGYRLMFKALSQTNIAQVYMNHVHGIGFRLIGEAFAAIPLCLEVVLSAYSQRAGRATGQMRNDYLYSVRVRRADWEKINFAALDKIDVVESMAQFELQRKMTPKGVFTAITPLH